METMVFELINFSFTYESEEVSCKLELGNYMLSVSEGITVDGFNLYLVEEIKNVCL